jgi:uncharacterized delta-60 repeat protein
MARPAVLLLMLLSITVHAHADDGDVDVTFGNGGRVTTDFVYSDYASTLAIQPDGKIIAAGQAFAWPKGGTQDFALARYNVDGSLDTAFGILGKITSDVLDSVDGVSKVWVQDDGKILSAGTTSVGSSRWALTRYNSDGSLDQTFGISGKIICEPLTELSLFIPITVAIQRDGQIITAGIASYRENDRGEFGLARYKPDCSFDETFGTSGKVTTDFSPEVDSPTALAIQSDGKIVVAGSVGPAPEFVVARYNNDGSLDTTFGTSGLAEGFSEPSGAYSLAILADGKIVAAGWAGEDLALARYNRDGSLDITWGSTGTVIIDLFGLSEIGRVLTVQSDGKIVISGIVGPSGTPPQGGWDSFVARFTRTGELDKTFGVEGSVRLPAILGSAMVIQPDGNIVIAGQSFRTAPLGQFPPSDFALLRLMNSDIPQTVELRFDSNTIAIGRSWTATVSGSKLNEQTYFDIRFIAPNSNTEQTALNWQRGTSAAHSLPIGTALGAWEVTGIRPHQDVSDHSAEFLVVAATLSVN